MKSKTIYLFPGMLLFNLLITLSIVAQHRETVGPANPAPEQMANGQPANFTYRLFVAPNKVYGYDIFLNGRIIFHQPAMAEPAGDKRVSLTQRPQADKAATLAIEKIKKGISPELTRQDIAQITAGKLNKN